jgi:putative phage-type endonuclease
MDKLINRKMRSDQISNIISSCFSWKPVVTKHDIKARKDALSQYKKQLEKLLEIPKVDQRTDLWYAMRKGIITASEFAQALGKAKFGTQKEFFKKKCGYEEEKSLSNTCPPLKWGIMLESVACAIYARRTEQVIHEFGLLKHPTIDFFGASPDGITNNGIMLEIKCPFQRKITGEVPLQYYYQIQGQLSVCDLNECDYLECGFTEYACLNEWLDNGYRLLTSHIKQEKEMGIIIETAHGAGDDVTFTYSYSPIYSNYCDKQELMAGAESWITETLKDNDVDNPNIQVRYWILDVYNVVRIFRDEGFLQEQFGLLKGVWDKVCEYRENYEAYMTSIRNNSRYSKSNNVLPAPTASNDDGYMFLDD